MHPNHFPIMPMHKRPWTTASPDPVAQGAHHPSFDARPKHPQPSPELAQARQAAGNQDQVTTESALMYCMSRQLFECLGIITT